MMYQAPKSIQKYTYFALIPKYITHYYYYLLLLNSMDTNDFNENDTTLIVG